MALPAILFSVAAAATFVAGFPVHRMLARQNIVDRPNERSSHSVVTVRGGGIAILIGISLAMGWLLASASDRVLVGALVAALGLAAVSFLDDLNSLPALVRFGCHAAAASTALWLLGSTGWQFDLGSGWSWPAPPLLCWGLGFLWLTGYTNAFNFMDGINGLAAGQALLTAAGAGLLAGLADGRWTDAPVLAAFVVAGAAAGFLPHNFPQARMFMGDVSSAPLGFLLAVLTLWLAQRHGVWLLIPLALLHANFVLDTAITLARRMARGERWYAPHREHFYQRLIRAGRSHSFVTGWEMALQLVVLALMIGYLRAGVAGRLALAGLVIVLWLGFFAMCERAFRRAGGGAVPRVSNSATSAPVSSTK